MDDLNPTTIVTAAFALLVFIAVLRSARIVPQRSACKRTA